MSIFTIAPHAPFLANLAAAVMDGRLLGGWERNGPFWLSDVTIIVPTQRARRALADIFASHPDHRGFLPDIRTFGGEEADEEPFLPPYNAPAMPKPTSLLHRRLVLSQLVAGWASSGQGQQAFSTPPSAAEIFSMAESLGRLIDDLSIEERIAADIRALEAGMAQELGAYWQQTLTFLDIALTAWPQVLAEGKLADAAMLRRARLDRQSAAAPHLFGDRPVIAAGSTGSIPATARLLGAIAALPRGALVLPGLDSAMSAATYAALLDRDDNPHGHPQYGLAQLLRTLNASPQSVVELAPEPHWRTIMMHRALALSAETALWSGQRLQAQELDLALGGVQVIQARNEDEEGRAIALAARAALHGGKTVGIVTPDRNLARRIAAELSRFDIFVDDAAGAPLFHSPAGRLARQVLNLVVGRCAPVDLIALLRNHACLLGRSRAEISTLADAVEMGLLRGQRPAPGLDGLRLALAAHRGGNAGRSARRLSEADEKAIIGLFDALADAIAPLAGLLDGSSIDAGDLAKALWHGVSALSAGAAPNGVSELADWAAQMTALTGTGHKFAPRGLDGVLSSLMAGFEVRNRVERRQDIAIWGQLEARLMAPDLMILGALNEDKWPAPADPGPWLSRGMRLAAGLEPPERMQGLAAHDFAQAMGNGEVIVAYADRVGASPALPSRLLQRLDAFAGTVQAKKLRQRGQVWLEEARRLDAVAQLSPARRPEPNPAIADRPSRISVTEVETLMRSPYDLYAKYSLGLYPLDPLGEDPDARERGTIIHAIFARFVIEKHDPMAPDALERLLAIADAEFAGLEVIGERREIWLRRFATAARQFLDFERGRNAFVRQRHAEIAGQWVLKLEREITIRGRADRVDLMEDGTLEILDFKTGSPPSPASMKLFEAPQLPVEALMASAGALEGIAPAPSGALTYVKIGLGPEAFIPSPFRTPDNMSVMEVADEVGRRMQGHIAFFLLRRTPLPARLLPLKGQRFAGAYEHLARTAEWTMLDGGEDET